MPDANDRNQRVERLREAAAGRSADATARAHRAITVLANRGTAVTFAAVAAEAKVSESFLYKHRELGDRIRSERRPVGRPQSRSAREAASAASLRVQRDVLAQQLEKAKLRIAELEAENAALRGEISDLRATRRRGR